MRIFKFKVMSSCLALAAGLTPLHAQESVEGATESDLGEIIVTARQRNESLQDAPASVTVFTADAIEATGIKTAADFVKLTSGVNIVTGGAEAGDTQINIRGLNGSRDAENNVALVVDGILKTNVAALNQNQGALQQIEVLKGPQGAIYGRNAAAGAIVITTKKPGDRLEANGRIGYGENSTYTASGVISGPLGDNVGLLVSGDYAKSDGFFRNTFLPSAANRAVYPGNSTRAASVDDFETYDVNARLVANLGDDTELDVKGRYGKRKGGAIVFNALFQIPTLFSVNRLVDSNIDVNDHVFRFDPNIDPGNDQQTIEASARLTSDLGFGTLKGFVSYSRIKNDFFADGTSGSFGFFAAETSCIASAAGTGAVVVQEPFQTIAPFRSSQPYGPSTCDGSQYQRRNQKDISAEIRIASNGDGAFNWQFGGYYLNIDRRVCVNLGLDRGLGVVEECFTTDTRNPTEALADDSFKTDVYAVFGNAEYAVSDRFKAGLALRYDIEDRSVSNNVPTGRRTRWVGNVLTGNPNGTATTPANYFLNPGLDPVYNPSGMLAPRSATFKQLQPKVTLSYEPSSDLTLFANYGIGFKSGGFNASGSAAVINGFFNNGTALFVPGNPINAGLTIGDQYRKERTSAFEAGAKGKFADGRVNFELAGYYTDVKDMQFFEFFVGPFGLLRVVSNIDKVELYGFEASANARIVEGWTIFASGNITESKIKKNAARPGTVGNKSPYTSDWTINLGSQISVPLNDALDIGFRADYRITGPTFFHTVQNNSVPNFFFGDNVLEGNFANSRRDAFGTLNLRFSLDAENFSLAAFATNALNRKFLSEVIPAPEFGGDFLSPGGRRTIGVEAGFKF